MNLAHPGDIQAANMICRKNQPKISPLNLEAIALILVIDFSLRIVL